MLEAIFRLIIVLSAMGSVFAIIVILIKKMFKNKLSATWHYYIWFLVIARFLIPYTPTSSFSVFNLFDDKIYQWKVPWSFSEEKYFDLSQLNKLNLSKGSSNYYEDASENIELMSTDNKKIPFIENKKESKNAYELTNKSYESINAVRMIEKNNSYKPWINIQNLSKLWILVVCILSIYLAAVYVSFKIEISKSLVCKDTELINLTEKCKLQLKINRNITIIFIDKIISPALIGVIKPRLIICSRIADELSVKEKNYIFLHELMHYKRKDILVNWIITVLLILHWFNPIMWIVFKEIKKDCEVSCDEIVLSHITPKEYNSYAKTLVKLLSIICRNKSVPGVTAVVNKSEIKRRIIMISKFKKKSILATIMAIIITLGVGIFGLTSAKSANLIENNENKKNNTNIHSSNPKKVLDKKEEKIEKKQPVVRKEELAIKNQQLSQKVQPIKDKKEEQRIKNISNNEIIDLIEESDMFINKFNQYYLRYYDPNEKLSEEVNALSEHTLMSLPARFTTKESVYKYCYEEYGFNKYFTWEDTKKLIRAYTYELNGRCYAVVGQWEGLCIDVIKITGKKFEGNKLYVTYDWDYMKCKEGVSSEKDTLIFDEGKWKMVLNWKSK